MGNDQVLVSFDAESLFTNTPTHLVLQIIKDNWVDIVKFSSIKSRATFLEGVELCVNNGYFVYNNTFYKQLFGVSMGGSLSVVFSGLYLDYVFNKTIESTSIKPTLLIKYVDDVLAVLDKDEVEGFLTELNSFHKKLKFTCEWEERGRLNFLDLTLYRRAGRITTKWYRKPIAKTLILNYYSWHPKNYKFNVMHNLISKAIRLTDVNYINEIKRKVFKILRDNWYPLHYIQQCWLKWYNKCFGNHTMIKIKKGIGDEEVIDHNNTTVKKGDNQYEYRSLEYLEGLSEKINAIIRNQGFTRIRLAYKPNNKIASLLSTMKDKIQFNKEKGLIYQIGCNSCPMVYIGHTSMWLESRISHHISNAKPSTKTNTALSTHLLNNAHNADWENVKILHREEKDNRRKLLEAMYINKSDSISMNDRSEIGKIGTVYANVLGLI